MNAFLAQAIIGFSGSLAVLGATYFTRSAYCLWGLALVVMMIGGVS